MYRIYQKSLLIGSDVPANFLLQEGAAALKRITGGDPLTAEGKFFRQGFEFDGDLNVLITSNSQLLLRLQTDAEAWKSRLVLIIFPSIEDAPPQKSYYWDYLLETEGEGILDIFLTACVAEDPGNRMGIATDDLVAAYGRFCIEKHWDQPVGASKQLPEAMARLFGAPQSQHAHKVGSAFEVRGYLGVKWITSGNGDTSTDDVPVSEDGVHQDARMRMGTTPKLYAGAVINRVRTLRTG